MAKQIYELGWVIGCGEFEFLKTEWKVFDTEDEAKTYGIQQQDELNDGLPCMEKAFDGYYYRFWYSRPIQEIDSHPIMLK